MNERTGTVVMGGAVTLGACSILHGNLAIEVTTQFEVSQPTAVFAGLGRPRWCRRRKFKPPKLRHS